MNADALATPEIDQCGGQHVGGCGKGQQLGDPQQSPAPEAAIGEQPTIGGPQHSAQACGAEQQRDGAGDLLATISAKAGASIPQSLEASLDEPCQRQQRHHGQHHRKDAQPASTGLPEAAVPGSRGQGRLDHCQPFAVISCSALPFNSPSLAAETSAWRKVPQALSTGSLPTPLIGYSWLAAA